MFYVFVQPKRLWSGAYCFLVIFLNPIFSWSILVSLYLIPHYGTCVSFLMQVIATLYILGLLHFSLWNDDCTTLVFSFLFFSFSSPWYPDLWLCDIPILGIWGETIESRRCAGSWVFRYPLMTSFLDCVCSSTDLVVSHALSKRLSFQLRPPVSCQNTGIFGYGCPIMAQ